MLILQRQPVFAPPVPALQGQGLPEIVLLENPRLKRRLAHQLSVFISPEDLP